MSSHSNNNQNNKEEEHTFHILPHPAKTNDPADLRRENNPIGSVMSSIAQLGNKGPHILGDEQKKGLEEPLSRDELRRRAAELNK
ncbi:hypothetical protein CPB86DRAFT_786469 [Serendipita vermifera]|nr:hypothetical protein CPB86DRAFT_786469 [Serendipita vermifera]